jgi:hypothetical protein
MVTVELAVE